jgi:CSLREA domain-containing protein
MKIARPGLIALASTLLISCGGADKTAEPLARVAVPSGWAAVPGLANCLAASYSTEQDNVMRAYIAYYGRPADSGGLDYWAGRLSKAGGNLNEIMADFGVSKEFTDRYGSLSSTDLVKSIYRQLFGRDPEQGGLDYWVGELTSGRKTLQSITLDVLFGASGSDASIVSNRLTVAKSFTGGSTLQSGYLAEADGNSMAAILGSVQADSTSANAACSAFTAMLDAQSGGLATTFAVTTTVDKNNGFCGSDCSLREAVAAANSAGGRAGISVPAGTYVVSLGPLNITGDVHIHGTSNSSVVLDGNANSRLFTLEPTTAKLVLSQMTLRNGKSDYGGAILNKGSLVLDRVTMSGNTARNGGALLNAGSLTGLGLTLSTNTAVSVDTNTGYGGGLYNEVGTYGLFASAVTGNSATLNGGGIYSTSTGTIINSSFTSNTSGATGGGIDSMGALEIVGSSFTLNSANDGGALASRELKALVNVTTSTFEDNTANGIDLGGGGGAFNYKGVLTVRDSVFNRNIAYGEGGGAIETNGALNLTNVLLDSNVAKMHSNALQDSAPGFGGAVLTIAGSTITIDNAQFTNNVAGNSGGAIYNDQNTQLTITNSKFTSNTAQGLFAGGGGYGGAIISEGNVAVADSTFTSNTSKVAGGALSTKFGIASISKSTLSGNSSANGGGIVAYSGTLSATDTIISANTATQNGGGVLNSTAQATLTRTTMTSNSAGGGGGAAFNDRGVLTIKDSSITLNKSHGSGGGALQTTGTLALSGSTLDGNAAEIDNPLGTAGPGQGGALLIIAGTTVTIDATKFSNNTAGNSGGAVYNGQNTKLTISNSQFLTNSAQGLAAGGGGYGGAIISEGALTLTGSTLTSNSSKIAGGGVSTAIGAATISSSTISSNTSANGGGVVAYSGTLSATDLILNSNSSSQVGGGLLNDAAVSTLTRVTMNSNSAMSWGGAFSNNSATGRVTLVSSSISGNSAPDGSAFVNFGTVSLSNSTVSGTCNNHKTVSNLGGNTFTGCSF